MSKVKTPIEQNGYNAYGYVDGKRVPVLSTAMGNCWDQDDQRAFCGHIVHCVNNHERLFEMLYEAEGHLRTLGYHYSNKVLDEKADKIESLLLELEAEKGGGV